MKIPVLSKSKIMNGIQCEKLFWLKIHHPEYAEKLSTATRMQMNEGTEVGELARKSFHDGQLIQADYWDFQAAADETKIAIENNVQVIYEASFLVDNFFARADILLRQDNKWHLIEVKKSTEVKNYQILDTAVQTWIIEASGLQLSNISIMYINRNCEFPNLDNLFSTTEITEEIQSLLPQFETKLKDLRTLSQQETEHITPIGQQCHSPFACPFIKHCWKDVPEKSVFDLPMVPGKRKWELFNSGKKLITDLNSNEFKGKSQKAIEVTQTNSLWIETDPIKSEMVKWQWPLYFFDFETLGLAVPRYRMTSSYSPVPFQFSCHILHADSDELSHFEYLHIENSDPRPKLIEAIVNNFSSEGSIVAYNKSFEISVIKKLAEFSPEHKEKLLSLVPRFVDPLPLFQNHVYHPDFLGSFSIKTVAPALIGEKLNYSNLTIGDGFAALAGADLILNDKIHGEEKQLLIKNLLAYCQQDTMAMVELVKWLFKKIKELQI